MEGMRTEQQSIQNNFHEFGSKVIKGLAVNIDTGSIAGASQGEATAIAQLKAEMARNQAAVASQLTNIMAALGNRLTAPTPAPSPTQQTTPTSNRGVMNGTGTIDTTLNDEDYNKYKNRGGGTDSHNQGWRQYRSYCPGKGINLK